MRFRAKVKVVTTSSVCLCDYACEQLAESQPLSGLYKDFYEGERAIELEVK